MEQRKMIPAGLFKLKNPGLLMQMFGIPYVFQKERYVLKGRYVGLWRQYV